MMRFAVITFAWAFVAFGSESLQTKVTLESEPALEFFKVLNVKEETDTTGARVHHFKHFSGVTNTAGQQLNVSCTYTENQGKVARSACSFDFYVVHPAE